MVPSLGKREEPLIFKGGIEISGKRKEETDYAKRLPAKILKILMGLVEVAVKPFHSRHGKTYLFSKVVNVSIGENEDGQMLTGMHTVADIFCVGCGSIVGWKYETAHEKSQKYKEVKFVLERYRVSSPDDSNYWVTYEAHVGGSDAHDV
ncbi:hypothetical protein CR513_46113, partial [Mucuna pruriens]